MNLKNNELAILGVVVFFTLVTYFLVEPYAHHVMHKQVESQNFAYNDLPQKTKVGDAIRGKELVMGAGACVGCHAIEAAGIPATMEPQDAAAAYGVCPPDLSTAGAIYDEKFLADTIKHPTHSLQVEHKFNAKNGKIYPMPEFFGAGGDIDQEVADMVAYLKSIAPKPEEITPKVAYEDACGRCHAVSYEKWTQIGTKPNYKDKKDSLAFDIKVLSYEDALNRYMGKIPPDLSMYIRSRGEHFISTFVENPQSHLPGTSMPRTGVSAESAEKIIEYLKDAGDTKRHEREAVGKNVMIYIIIFAIFAFLWKRQVWRDLH